MKQFFAPLLVLIITANLGYAQNNSAQITQTANNTQSTVIQTGDDNDAVVDIINRDGATSSIKQVGDINTAIQYLTGDGPPLYEIEQTGDGNTAEQDDKTFGYDFPTDWFVFSTWTDDSITQVNWTSPITGVTSKVKIVQTGSQNKAYQYGNKYYALIEQDGNLHEATQNQTGSGNKAEINQRIGNNNKAYQLQTGSNNSAVCVQNGHNLIHNLLQNGDNFSITVTQTNNDSGSNPGAVNIIQQ